LISESCSDILYVEDTIPDEIGLFLGLRSTRRRALRAKNLFG